MQLSKGETIAILGLVFALVLAVIGIVYQGAEPTYGYKRTHENPPWWMIPDWWALIVNLSIAGCTVFLAYYGFRAFSQTKRNVEAYISSERGVMWLSTADARQITHIRVNSSDELGWHIYFSFENIGNSSLMLIGSHWRPFAMPKHALPEPMTFSYPLFRRTILVKKGGIITHNKAPDVVSIIKPWLVPQEIVSQVKGGAQLGFRGMLLFKTMQGVHYRYGFTCLADTMQADFRPVEGDGYTFDVPDPGPHNFIEESDPMSASGERGGGIG